MSENMIKTEWRKRWENARDNEHDACVSCDWKTARFWGKIATGIEIGFLSYFGQDFYEYLCD